MIDPFLLVSVVEPREAVRTWFLVSSELHDAAAAAVHTVDCKLVSQRQLESLQLYTQRHGQHLQHISLSSVNNISLRLSALLGPHCSNLRSIRLASVRLDEPQPLAALALLPHITHLTLDTAVWGANLPPAEAGLSALSSLQELQLVDMSAISKTSSALADALAQLPNLTSLQLEGAWVTSGMLRNLRDVAGLQRLQAHGCRFSEGVLSGLQHLSRLSHLQLCAMQSLALFDRTNSITGLSSLTALQHLSLQRVQCIDMPTLSKLPSAQLTFVKLSNSNVSPEGVPGVAGLLTFLSGARSLQHLELSGTISACLTRPTASAYAALTASSVLTCLIISDCRMKLSEAAQHMFRRPLPTLRLLELDNSPRSKTADDLKLDGQSFGRLVSSCLDLQSLQLCRAVQPTAQLSALSRLQHLTLLEATGFSSDSLASVCRISGLRSLFLRQPHHAGLMRAHLQQLTVLRQLTHLHAQKLVGPLALAVATQQDDDDDEAAVPVPVWLQLLGVV